MSSTYKAVVEKELARVRAELKVRVPGKPWAELPISFGDADEAIKIGNDTIYGLAAAVFGRDAARALDVAHRIESGICHVNGPTVHDEAQMPFGGVKASGYGRFGGKAGIDAFTELRWITFETEPGHYPI